MQPEFCHGLLVCALLAACACAARPERELERTFDAGRQALERGNFADAAAAAERGAVSSRGPADLRWAWKFRLLQAEIHLLQLRAREARPLLSDTPPDGDRFADIRSRRAYLLARLTFVETSPAEALEALEEARSKAGDNDETRLDIDAFAGQMHFRLRQWNEGETLLTDVLDKAERADDLYRQAVVLNDLGFARVVRNRYGDALPWFERVIQRKDLEPFDHYVRALNNAGICYSRLGQFELAIAAQRRAVDIRRQRGPVLEFEQALGSLGNSYYLQGDWRAALPYYEEARSVSLAGNLLDHAAIWAGNLAVSHVELGEWDLAERYNNESRELREKLGSGFAVHNTLNAALIAHGRGQQHEAQKHFEAARKDPQATPDVTWDAEAGLARVQVAARNTEGASRHFEAALAAIERTRSDLIRPDYKLTFLTRLITFYQDYVNVLVDDRRVERALEVADSSRGRVLAERQGVSAPASAAFARFRAIARDSNAVLLSYWLAPLRSFLWIVSGEGVQIVGLPAAKEIESLVREHQQTIENALSNPIGTRQTAGDRLYQLLVAPALPSLGDRSKLIVAADGALHRLNFETLPVDGPRRHYLIEDVEVQVAPSLALLAAGHRRPDDSPTLLLVGNPTPRPEFPALSYASAEMTAIASHFPADRVTTFEAERASPASYLEAGPSRFAMIHFTAHATANTESPLDSAVILAGPEPSYKLYARDIVSNASTPLEADLVTVSACRSAGERTYSGEGLIGFAWAFLRAGARRVVAGLWDVDDRSTAELMDRFYGAIAKGERPAHALRQAKLSLVAQGGNAAKPYYWGAFQMFTLTP
jgi:CHAT domain-containing protein/tetratricopeptide (TPR) repeat protein